jgi:hypothetical protein
MALHSNKDKAMASRLKAEGNERLTGRCVICGKIIRNGSAIVNHITAHAYGAENA